MSQRLTILKMLRSAPGRKITGEQLIAAGIFRYTARIEELRKGKPHGPSYDIRTEGDTHSALAVYRLVNDPADVESGAGGAPPASSAGAALNATGDVEGRPAPSRADTREAHTSAPSRGASLNVKPLNPYEYDLLDAA